MNDPLTAARLRIYGRVQGVWFRAWTANAANELDLAGWVRNRTDGSVEALFVGPPAAVEAIIVQCREGPPAARVDKVEREMLQGAPIDEIRALGFRKLPTL